MRRAVVLGGSGQIGRAVARRLLSSGWDVDLTGRNAANVPPDLTAAGARFSAVDRDDGAALESLVGRGTDLLVDCLCFTAANAVQLLPVLGDIASTVMISSKAVYVDSAGRHVNSAECPVFAGPVAEDQGTIAPGYGNFNSPEGYGSNKIAAEHVLLDSGHPVSVLRASKVHGEGASPAREWVFAKRILDGRQAVFLASSGTGIDHTTAAGNVAALIECVALNPGARILNSADPDAPSALEISRTVAAHFGYEWEEVLLAGQAAGTRRSHLGAHPWETAAPIVLDTRASLELGYVPAGDYASTVKNELDWLSASSRDPELASRREEFFADYVDYAAEDAYLSRRSDPFI